MEFKKNHYVVPFEKRDNPRRTGGICNTDGKMLTETVRFSIPYSVIIPNNKVKCIDNAIFLGHITNHYGHFLLETLPRFWIFKYYPMTYFQDKTIVFINFLHSNSNLKENIIFNNILNILHLKNLNFTIINTLTKVKSLYIPKFPGNHPVYNFKLEKSIIIPDIYQEIISNIPIKKTYSKLYISRLDRGGSIKLTNFFKSLGFTIINPTQKTFIDDLVKYKSAKIIAGIDGTGLHNICFMSNKTKYMIELKSRKNKFLKENKGLAKGQNFFNDLHNIKYTVIPFFKMTFPQLIKEVKKTIANIGNK